MSNRRKKKTNQVQPSSATKHKTEIPQTVQIEIDYDKLAESIVKANKMQNTNQFKHSKYRIKIMNFLNGIIYLSGYSYCVIKIFNIWANSLYELRERIFLTTFLIIMALILFLMQQESLDESKDETVLHFNSNVALYAFIVAIIELSKG